MNQVKFKKKDKACFFDRDGVLNKDTGYLYKKEEFEWIAGAPQAISLLKSKKFKVIVVTNQSGKVTLQYLWVKNTLVYLKLHYTTLEEF